MTFSLKRSYFDENGSSCFRDLPSTPLLLDESVASAVRMINDTNSWWYETQYGAGIDYSVCCSFRVICLLTMSAKTDVIRILFLTWSVEMTPHSIEIFTHVQT